MTFHEPGSGHYVDPSFPPWFNEETQARMLKWYRGKGYDVDRLVWMTDYRREEIERLLALAADDVDATQSGLL